MQNNVMLPFWLELARRFQALAQTGLAYCTDPFDRERYEEIRRLAAQMMTGAAGPSHAVRLKICSKPKSVTRLRKSTCALRSLTKIAYCSYESATTDFGLCPAGGPMSVIHRACQPFVRLKRNLATTSWSGNWLPCTTGTSTVTRRCRITSIRSFSYARCVVARLRTRSKRAALISSRRTAFLHSRCPASLEARSNTCSTIIGIPNGRLPSIEGSDAARGKHAEPCGRNFE